MGVAGRPGRISCSNTTKVHKAMAHAWGLLKRQGSWKALPFARCASVEAAQESAVALEAQQSHIKNRMPRSRTAEGPKGCAREDSGGDFTHTIHGHAEEARMIGPRVHAPKKLSKMAVPKLVAVGAGSMFS